MTMEPQVWRSMLFVPAHVDRFVDAAHARGADACILDLEDSVPVADKPRARWGLADAVSKVSRSGAAALVRINAEPAWGDEDLAAAVIPPVRALVVPKVESAEAIRQLDARMSTLEAERGIAQGQVRLIAQIEHVGALPQMDAIASASPRLLGMSLGTEDFAMSAGMEPVPEALYAPSQQLVFACRRAGILPFGFPGSIAIFREPDLLHGLIRQARQMGFVGACAIHPAQVEVMNEGFLPPEAEVMHARELLEAWDRAQAEGRAAFEFRGRMVDPPVVARAREVLRRAG